MPNSLPVPNAPSKNGCNPVVKAEAFLVIPALFLVFFLSAYGLPQPSIKVHWKESERLLSVMANHASRSDVLREIARQTGIELEGENSLHGQVSIDFSDVSLIEGLRSVLDHTNYAFIGNGASSRGERPLRLLIFGDRTPSEGALKTRKPLAGPPPAALGDPVLTATIADEEDTQPDDRLETLAALQSSAARGDTQFLQDQILNSDLVVQKAAFEALVERDPQSAVEALARAAKSEDPELRAQAVLLLGGGIRADAESALGALREAISDKDVTVKASAIQALAIQEGPEAIDLLRQALRNVDPAIRGLVIESVVQSPAGRVLLEDAAADPDDDVSSQVSSWMGQKETDDQ